MTPYLRKLSIDDFLFHVILWFRVLKYRNKSQKSSKHNARTFSPQASCETVNEQDDGRFDFGASSLLLKPIDDDIALGQVGDNVHVLPVPAVRAHLYAVLVLDLRGGAGEAERDSGKGVSLTELGLSQSRTRGACGERRGWSFVMGRESCGCLPLGASLSRAARHPQPQETSKCPRS